MTSWPLFSRQFSILKYFLFSPVALVAQIAPPPTRANTEPPTTIIGARNPVAVATPYKPLAKINAPAPVPTVAPVPAPAAAACACLHVRCVCLLFPFSCSLCEFLMAL